MLVIYDRKLIFCSIDSLNVSCLLEFACLSIQASLHNTYLQSCETYIICSHQHLSIKFQVQKKTHQATAFFQLPKKNTLDTTRCSLNEEQINASKMWPIATVVSSKRNMSIPNPRMVGRCFIGFLRVPGCPRGNPEDS